MNTTVDAQGGGTHPTGQPMLDKARQHLVKAAEQHGLRLRQNYNRAAPGFGRADPGAMPTKQFEAHAPDPAHPALA